MGAFFAFRVLLLRVSFDRLSLPFFLVRIEERWKGRKGLPQRRFPPCGEGGGAERFHSPKCSQKGGEKEKEKEKGKNKEKASKSHVGGKN